MQAKIAYFSMEIELDSSIPTYSGGLGVLAGDTLRAAADLAIPMVGVSLLHRKGYFRQRLDEQGNQHEDPVSWSLEDMLTPMDATVSVAIEGRQVRVRAWRFWSEAQRARTFPFTCWTRECRRTANGIEV